MLRNILHQRRWRLDNNVLHHRRWRMSNCWRGCKVLHCWRRCLKHCGAREQQFPPTVPPTAARRTPCAAQVAPAAAAPDPPCLHCGGTVQREQLRRSTAHVWPMSGSRRSRRLLAAPAMGQQLESAQRTPQKIWWLWWLWWLWCGREALHVCLATRTSGMHFFFKKKKRASTSVLAPSAGLTSRNPLRLFPPKAGSRRPRVQTSPNHKSRKKIARLVHLTPPPPLPHSYGGREAQSFPSPQCWMPWVGNDMRRCTWTCLPGKPDPLTSVTACIHMMSRSNDLPFTITISDPW